MHILRIGNPGILHRRLDGVGDLLNHRGTSDVLRQQFRAQRRADHQPRLVGGAGLAVAGEDRGVRRDDAITAARPNHRHVVDLGFGARAELEQHAPKRLVGQNAGEIVDPAIAFGLADHRDDLVGAELAGRDQSLKAARILNGFQFDLRNFNRHSRETPRCLGFNYRSSHPRPVLAAQHLFIAFTAVDHGRRYISRLPQPGPQRLGRDLVDDGLLAHGPLPEHHAIICSRR